MAALRTRHNKNKMSLTVAEILSNINDPATKAAIANAESILSELDKAKRSEAEWQSADPRGIPSEIRLKSEQLDSAVKHRMRIEARLSIERGDDLPNNQPTSSLTLPAGTPMKGAPSQPIKPATLKRSAMVSKYRGHWPSIESDLQHSNENDLAIEAKAPKHGLWYEAAALAWARQRGKVSDSPIAAGSVNSIFNTPGKIHTIGS